MKKCVFLLIAMLSAVASQAGRLTEQQALQRAQSFMPGKTFVQKVKPRLSPSGTEQSGEAAYYVFNAAEQGFVVVSADDRTRPILGYSEQGHFDEDALPDNVRYWMREYADQMAWLDAHPQAAASPTLAGAAPISPLLGETKWRQGAPFNASCPKANGNPSLAGCVAVTMAQIMYYHQWPAKTKKTIPGYTTQSLGLKVASIPVTTIDWGHMLPYYESYNGEETAAQKKAAADLMLMCAASVNMDFSPTSSMAYSNDVVDAMQTYFDYSAAAKYVSRADYRSAEWNQLIYDELAQSRPVYYSGRSVETGHAFVVDGYDDNDYFHVNWGWGGGNNGYFLLSILDPYSTDEQGFTASSEGYSSTQAAIIGLEPNTGQTLSELILLTTRSISLSEDTPTVIDKADDGFHLTAIAEFRNFTSQTATFNIAYGLFDANDEMLFLVSSVTKTQELDPNWGYSGIQRELTIPGDVADGVYKIKPVSKLVDTEDWMPNFGTDKVNIRAEVTGNRMALQLPLVDLAGTISVPGAAEVKSKVLVNALITNRGTDFNGQLYFLADGQLVGARYFDAEAGESKTIAFTFCPETISPRELSVNLRSWDAEQQIYVYTPIAAGTVDVEPSSEICLQLDMMARDAVDGIVTGSRVNIDITANNFSKLDYTQGLLIRYYKRGNDGWFYYAGLENCPLELASLETTTKTIAIDRLEAGDYLFECYYYNDEEWVYQCGLQLVVKEVDVTKLHDGDVFSIRTPEGVLMTFMVISAAEKTCQVGTGEDNSQPAVDVQTSGSLVIPSEAGGFRVIVIAKNAFSGCFRLKSVSIPSSVTVIGEWAFHACTSISSVKLSEGLLVLRDGAFYNCTSLTNIDLPSSLITIGSNALERTDLYSLYIPAAVSSIQDYAVCWNENLTRITVDEANLYYESPAGSNAIVRSADRMLVLACKTSVIPDDVTSLFSGAFCNCHGMTSFQVPPSVETIYSGAFWGLSSLKHISLPNSLRYMDWNAFYGCTGLESISSSVMEPFAFSGVFPSEVFSQATLYIPAGTKPLYETTDDWNKFQNIVELEELGISSMAEDGQNLAVYSLSGVLLKRVTSVCQLPAGIYVVNGRKVVVK